MAVIYLLEKVHMNLNTTTGQNIRHILSQAEEADIFKIKPKLFKKNFKFEKLPEEENWKVDIIKEIVDLKHNVCGLTSDDQTEPPVKFTEEELYEILSYVSTC